MEEQIDQALPPIDIKQVGSTDSEEDAVHKAVSKEADTFQVQPQDEHQDYLRRPFEYFDRILHRSDHVDIDTIMVARELKKQYKLQYKRACQYLTFLTDKLAATIEEDTEPENVIDGPRLLREYFIPEQYDNQ